MGQKPEAGSSVKPTFLSAFIDVDNVAGLTSHSAEAEITEEGLFSVTRETFTNVGEKVLNELKNI